MRYVPESHRPDGPDHSYGTESHWELLQLNAKQLKTQVSKKLGKSIPAEVWSRLDDEGWISDFYIDANLQNLANAALQIAKANKIKLEPLPAPKPARNEQGIKLPRVETQRRMRRMQAADERNYSLARVLAVDARRRFDVSGYRQRFTNGRALRPQEIQQWVASTDPGLARRIEDPWDQRPVGTPGEFLTLPCVEPSCLPVAGKAMESLAVLARKIAPYYNWAESDAAGVVLTDCVPGKCLPYVGFRRGEDWCPALGTITITVDLSATRDEVADLYEKKRWELVKDMRIKRQQPKALRLAAFYAENYGMRPDEELVAQWNRIARNSPQWKVGRFNEEGKAAVERLLGVPLGSKDWTEWCSTR